MKSIKSFLLDSNLGAGLMLLLITSSASLIYNHLNMLKEFEQMKSNIKEFEQMKRDIEQLQSELTEIKSVLENDYLKFTFADEDENELILTHNNIDYEIQLNKLN